MAGFTDWPYMVARVCRIYPKTSAPGEETSMSSFYGKPRMMRTRTEGLTVGWRQGLYERSGVGTLFISILGGEREWEITGVERKYLNQLRSREDAVDIMNQLLRMYL